MVIDFSPFFSQTSPYDRLFEALWTPLSISQRPYAYPPLNLAEDTDRIVARCELPGMDISDLELTLSDASLIIKGERKGAKGKYYRQERPTGFFQRVINLNTAVNRDQVTATMKDGILEIVLPKAESSKPKKIAIDIV